MSVSFPHAHNISQVKICRDGKTTRTLSAGQSFGEIALLYHSAARVTATTTTHCTLFFLSPKVYKSVLVSSAEGKTKAAMACLVQIKQLNCLSSDQLHEIVALVDQVEVPVGKVLYSRGSLVSAQDPYFYMVEEGEVTLTHHHPVKPQVIRAGGHFGQQALGLHDLHTVSHQHHSGPEKEHINRPATATASKGNSSNVVKLLRLHKDDVDIKMGSLRELARCNLITERFSSIGFLRHLPKTHLRSMAEHTHTYDIASNHTLQLEPDNGEDHCNLSDYLLVVVEGAVAWMNSDWSQCMSHCFTGEGFKPLADRSGVLLGPGCLIGQLSCRPMRSAQAVKSLTQLNNRKLVAASASQVQDLLQSLLISRVSGKSGVPFPSLDSVNDINRLSASDGLLATLNPLSACEEEGGAVVLALHSRWFLTESEPTRKVRLLIGVPVVVDHGAVNSANVSALHSEEGGQWRGGWVNLRRMCMIYMRIARMHGIRVTILGDGGEEDMSPFHGKFELCAAFDQSSFPLVDRHLKNGVGATAC